MNRYFQPQNFRRDIILHRQRRQGFSQLYFPQLYWNLSEVTYKSKESFLTMVSPKKVNSIHRKNAISNVVQYISGIWHGSPQFQ